VKKPMVFGDPSSHGARYAAKYGWEKYAKEYEAGWRAASRPESAKWDSGASSDAWDDGYLDRAALRDKWHLVTCPKHGNLDGECGEA
jgi:hypothetical protein